jgi:hypothetical protein
VIAGSCNRKGVDFVIWSRESSSMPFSTLEATSWKDCSRVHIAP